MSIISQPIDNHIDLEDKFDELIETIEKASALAAVGCCSKIDELNGSTIFRYFIVMSEILEMIKNLSNQLKKVIIE